MKDLLQKKAELIEAKKTILSNITQENRSLNDDENTQLGTIKDDLKNLEDQIALSAELAEEERSMIDALPQDNKTISNTELRSFIQGEIRSLSVGVAKDGGHAVPPELDNSILTQLRDNSVFRQNASNVSIDTHKYEKLVSVGGTSAGWASEGDARSETDTSQLEKVILEVNSIYAYPKTTQEILNHSQIDLMAWLTSEVAEEMGQTEEAAFWNGDGIGKPKGLLTYPKAATKDATRPFGTIQEKTSATSGVIDGDDLISLMHSLHVNYRANAKFYMNDATLEKVRKLKDTDGNYLWRAGIEADAPNTLLGKPVEVAENIQDNYIVYADLNRAYTVLDHTSGTQMQPDSITSPGFYKVYTSRYVGGGLIDSKAVKFLKQKA